MIFRIVEKKVKQVRITCNIFSAFLAHRVAFFVSENVAQYAQGSSVTCSISSLYSTQHGTRDVYCRRAINGDTGGADGIWNAGDNCVHSNQEDAANKDHWWEVDLGQTYPILYMLAYSRTEGDKAGNTYGRSK